MERELDFTTKAIESSADGFDDAGVNVGKFSKEVENASNIAEDAENSFANLGVTLKAAAIQRQELGWPG